MGISTPRAEPGPAESLDFVLSCARERVHRLLHDEAGPSLCAAGLHLDLLTAAIPAEGMARESAEALRTALESALGAVQVLLVENDPKLFQRGGLRGGLNALKHAGLLDWEEPEQDPGWGKEQEDVGFRVARECATAAAMASPRRRVAVAWGPGALEVRVEGGGGTGPDWGRWLPGWRHFAGAAGMSMEQTQAQGGLELRLAPARPPGRDGDA